MTDSKSKTSKSPTEQVDGMAEEPKPEAREGLNRRQVLGAGGVTVGALAGGLGTLGSVLTVAGKAGAVEIAPDDPIQRSNNAFQVRHQAAIDELQMPVINHPTNGDEELFPNRIGNFHKSLPHNALGEVDPAAYEALLFALGTGDFADVEAVPAGGNAAILNPLGGLAFALEGPDSPAVGVNPPPSVASAELAAQAAELYWMALLRDVPFADYGSNALVAQAAADLSTFSGYTGPRGGSGQVTPDVLFRVDYPGVLDGPIVSQFLLASFRFDGIPIDPKISTAAPGMDFLTDFDEWLEAQNGFPGGNPGADPRDPVLRYPRNVRDLGRTAGQDTIYSQYFKARLILGGGPNDAANPYLASSRQRGFATFGTAHLLGLLGLVPKAERHTWYQKWNVHRFLRPEAYGGLVHNRVTGAANYPIHSDLLGSAVLPLVFDYNRQQNLARLGKDEGSFLLPMLFGRGSPTHPSFPAGHAVSAGACVALLKAWYDEDALFPDPVKASADGLSLEPYVPGVDGPPLTIGGELNKLCHNLSFGRDMSGVHWRADDVEGNRQGEEVTIRILREEKATYPEPFTGFSLTRFDGTTITV